jgi:enamine deaminase RidA (YjgF/YER057c/UK114 family)
MAHRVRMESCDGQGRIGPELGSLDRVRQVVKAVGMVNSAPGFDQQAPVLDGFSDLMIEVFGEGGRHVRTAVGVAELPRGISVDVEVVIEVESPC